MKQFKVVWEVNQYRPDDFSDLTDQWDDYVIARDRKEASDVSFDNVSFEMGGGRLLTITQIN